MTKFYIVKAMFFPVVRYRYESWTIKKVEHWRADAFEPWCWKRYLSPLDCKEIKPGNSKGNQPWIFNWRTDAEAEVPILWPPEVKSQLLGKDGDAGKDWGQEKGVTGWDGWVASSTQWTWVWASSGRQCKTGKPGVLQSMGLQRIGKGLMTEQQQHCVRL